METKSKIINPTVVLLMMVLISSVNSNLWYLKYFNNIITTASTTTSTNGIAALKSVDITSTATSKQPAPPVPQLSEGQSFLQYFWQGPNNFDKMSGAQNHLPNNLQQNNIGSSKAASEDSTRQSTIGLTDTTTSSTTTQAPTTTTKSSTTTRTQAFSTTTTTLRNPFFNGDGSLNRDRPEMLTFYGKQPTEIKDRDGQLSALERWRQKFLRTPAPDNKSREKPKDPETSSFSGTAHGSTRNVEVSSVSSIPSKSQNGFVETGPNGGIYTVDLTSPKGEKDTEGDRQGFNPTEVQDKPFYASSQLWYSERSSEVGFDTSTDYTRSDQAYNRPKRAVGTDNENSLGCYSPTRFPPREYYRQCFSKVNERCKRQTTYIGDDTDRLSENILVTISRTRSSLLTSYLQGLLSSLGNALLKVVEYPSCEEVTSALRAALLTRSIESCLYQNGTLCEVLEDSVARPDLARMIVSPLGNENFTTSLSLNLGEISSFCPGGGGSIIVADIVLLMTTNNNKYTKTPIPGIRAKF